MKSLKAALGIMVVAILAVSVATFPVLAQTATFDDLPNLTPVPPGYTLPGLDWDNIWVVNGVPYLAANYPGKEACVVSSPNCVFNYGGVFSAISRASAFDFTGAYFLGWADLSCGDPGSPESFNCAINLTVTGFSGGTVVGSSTISLAPYATQWFAFNFSNVDLVTFDTQANNGGAAAWYLGDNFVFTETSAVPEPASIALLGTGLVGLYGAIRRRREKES